MWLITAFICAQNKIPITGLIMYHKLAMESTLIIFLEFNMITLIII